MNSIIFIPISVEASHSDEISCGLSKNHISLMLCFAWLILVECGSVQETVKCGKSQGNALFCIETLEKAINETKLIESSTAAVSNR